MQLLLEPQVLSSAAVAAFATTAACYPRLALWPRPPGSIWFLLLVLFVVAFVLWAFVFAWHGPYTKRPAFTGNIARRDWILATAWGLAGAVLLLLAIDPVFHQLTPQDYPTAFKPWLAMTLFGLGFELLFLCFAPFAFFVRLFQSPKAAVALTVLWGLFVLYLKISSSRTPIGAGLALELVVVRLVVATLALFFYLRGGVWLVIYCGFWIQLRHLPGLLAHH